MYYRTEKNTESDSKTESKTESKTTKSAEKASSDTVTTAESALLVGDEYENTVKNIVDMGYPRDQVSMLLHGT